MKAQGIDVVVEHLGTPGVIPITPELARAFNMPIGTPVVERGRREIVDGVPYRYSKKYYLASLVDEESLRRIRQDKAFNVRDVIKGQRPLARMHEEIIARAVTTKEEMGILNAVKGTPVLQLTRINYADDMPATLQITQKLIVTPLIDIQSVEFAKQYELGVWWSMYGDEQGNGPVPASYLVTNLKDYAEHDYFGTNDPYHLHHLGFFPGMYHGGILSPHTGQLRPNVTMLAYLDHREARRGYQAGREFYFVDAEPHERRDTECSLIERLRESVSELFSWHDDDGTWFFAVGCLLGELSGQLFPMTQAEQRVYLPQRQRVEQACQRYKVAQEHPLRSAMLQGV